MYCDRVSILGLLVVISATINSISCLNAFDCADDLPNYRYYPYDCQKYFGCQSRALNVYTCPNNLYWNDIVKACDVHENTDCSHIIPFPDPDCSDGKNTYYLYPYDCSKFWECYEKRVYLLQCPNRSLWNEKIKECDEHTNVDCSHVIPYPASTTSTTTSSTTPLTTTRPTTTRSTTPRPTTPSTTPPPPEPVTPPECTYDNTYYPYPYDCSKFYECSNGKPVIMQCKDDLVWNNAIKTCDRTYNVDCCKCLSITPAK
ncbi:unnamed protein product [Psylliodes chrysocephalus]|uniref:Chitin-binding type-2 domain-containing protein n=1 Tax=Psylliodes chrysocephalus TaxID=3402493 RepID=A0A9P0G6R5_9CUCU|nr:unnamed protein product [Psylliodes chrysocephala]